LEGCPYASALSRRVPPAADQLARTGNLPGAKVAAYLGIVTSWLRRWMQDDIDGGRREGLNTDEPSWWVFVVSCAPPR
jgi:hypothetical protein